LNHQRTYALPANEALSSIAKLAGADQRRLDSPLPKRTNSLLQPGLPSPRFRLRRSLLTQDVDECSPADISQFAKAGLAAPRRLHELLGNRLAAIVIAAVRKLAANLVKHNVHVGLRTLVKFAQFQRSQDTAATRLKPPVSRWSLPLFPDRRNRRLLIEVNQADSGGR